MTVTSSLSEKGDALTIVVEGSFDFSTMGPFRQCYERASINQVTAYIVDLAKANQIDSSALGLLLVLRDHANENNADITIINCMPNVKKLLEVSSFHTLFTIA